MTTMSRLYADCVEAVAALAGALSEEDLARQVPATPDWTVHELLAHLAGGGSDALSGRMDGAPGPGWTARHVSERTDTSPAELIDELRSDVPGIQASVEHNPRPALVWNISVHLADLHEALGMGRPAEELWRPVLEMAAAWRLGDVRLEVDDYELFRGLFSRRSRSQMRAWGGLDEAQLNELPLFGPRDDDQPIPG